VARVEFGTMVTNSRGGGLRLQAYLQNMLALRNSSQYEINVE
jgi:hypothetical protein